MTDNLTPSKRREAMERVKNRNTAPEIAVRRILHRMGYRFRLHRRDLPGQPDIVLPRHQKVILVHGCFWHGHEGCSRSARPTTNVEFWERKLNKNLERDRRAETALRALGWQVLVVWQCQTRDAAELAHRLQQFLKPN